MTDAVAGTLIKSALKRAGLLEWVRATRDGLAVSTLPLRYRMRAVYCWLAGVSGGLPIPPPRLTYLVSGHYDVYSSLTNGVRAARSMEAALQRNGQSLDALDAILDLGCGSGRVLRNLKSLRPGVLHATDYNPLLVDWCRKHLPFVQYRTNELEPPLEYHDSAFDLVYMFSIFTHWDIPTAQAWLSELARVVRPGGYLVFSTHGAKFRHLLSPSERADFDAGHVVVRRPHANGENACAVYHPEKCVRESVAGLFTVVDFISEGAEGNGGQDLWIVKRQRSA